MTYNESMPSSYKQLVQIISGLFFVGFFGSCTTFHTPLSREYLTTGSVFSPTQDSADEEYSSDDVTDGKSVKRSPSSVASEARMGLLNFDWPVDSARLTRGFLPKKRRPHLGIDLAASKGTPILASQSGTVIYAGREFRGYGKMVLIESGFGWATLYAHFDKILVSEGQKVHQGEVIGAMGRTGRATGVHLHFEIRKNTGPVDPLPLLPETVANN